MKRLVKLHCDLHDYKAVLTEVKKRDKQAESKSDC